MNSLEVNIEQFNICILYGHYSFLDFFSGLGVWVGGMCVWGVLCLNETESLIKSKDNQFG